MDAILSSQRNRKADKGGDCCFSTHFSLLRVQYVRTGMMSTPLVREFLDTPPPAGTAIRTKHMAGSVLVVRRLAST